MLALPEIVDDQAADYVIQQLQELLNSDPELTVAILDALASLRCGFFNLWTAAADCA